MINDNNGPATKAELVRLLSQIAGKRYVLTGDAQKSGYGGDRSLFAECPFDILVKPCNEREIAGVLRTCYEAGIAVTPRGGGSGVTGGALPIKGGVVLSLERMNRIIAIDEVECSVTAEAGVINADLCKAVEERGLFYPVAPSSSMFSFIGGNVAENAGSPQSCKYGMTSDYVMNLEVVLPDGRIIWTGSNRRKNATGLNLTPLFVGSEGTLGVISKVVLKLMPQPGRSATLLAAFRTLEDACQAIIGIRRSAVRPISAELICENALRLTKSYLQDPLPLVLDDIGAHLLIEVEGGNAIELDRATGSICGFLGTYGAVEILRAERKDEKMKLGKARFEIGNAMTCGDRRYRDIDACVPLVKLAGYIRYAEAVCKKYEIPLVCFGHAMDGNVHTMLLTDKTGTGSEGFDMAVTAIYTKAVELGGVLSGEHGIGMLQKEYMGLQFDANQMDLMRDIKKLFDPRGLLNPGKFI